MKTRDTRLYLPIALVVTLAMYAKYSIAACAVALGGRVAADRPRQSAAVALAALGVALTALLVMPNALWQIGHGFPMLEVLHNDQLNRHALRNGMADESPNRWINALYMFGLQFMYQNPLFAAVWVWGLVWLWRERAYRYLTVAYLLLLGLLVASIGRGYYIQGFYPALFAAGAVAIEGALSTRPLRLRSHSWRRSSSPACRCFRSRFPSCRFPSTWPTSAQSV